MADNPEPSNGGESHGPSRSANFGFLTRKIGPLPIWAYAAIAVGVYYWYTHYGPGAQKAQQAASTNPSTGHPWAQDYARQTQVIRTLRRGREPKNIHQPHMQAQSAKGANDPTAGPIPPNVNPGGPEKPPGDNHNGHGGQAVDVTTRWRGPYQHPHKVQTGEPATVTEPDHRPLGV